MTKIETTCSGAFLGGGNGLFQSCSAFNNGGSIRSTGRHFGNGGIRRDEDLTGHVENSGRKSKSLGVISGASSGHSGVDSGPEAEQRIHGAANFETSGALQIFGLEHN